jgi:hypothetical protein
VVAEVHGTTRKATSSASTIVEDRRNVAGSELDAEKLQRKQRRSARARHADSERTKARSIHSGGL